MQNYTECRELPVSRYAPGMSSLRERKRVRTRQALIDAAADLFEQRGYDGTTIADIAAAAGVSTRTFFSYFASKDDVLFPDADARVRAALTAIDERRPDEGPTEILVRALSELGDAGDDLVGPMAALRLRFVRTVPSVRGRGLQRQLDAQTEIAARLHAAFPDILDEVEAAALVGAFVGAIASALEVLLRDEDDPDVVRQRLQRATAVALRPWT
jgi:AcrR family transcriptional regulator